LLFDGEVACNADALKQVLIKMLTEVGLGGKESAQVLSMPQFGSQGWKVPSNLWLNEVHPLLILQAGAHAVRALVMKPRIGDVFFKTGAVPGRNPGLVLPRCMRRGASST